jgi:hypothetical protein
LGEVKAGRETGLLLVLVKLEKQRTEQLACRAILISLLVRLVP